MMTRIGKISILLGLGIFCALAVAPTAKAGPVFFSGVTSVSSNPGGPQVDLFSNPGTTLLSPELNFRIDYTGSLPPGVTNTVLITYREATGVTFTRSFEIPVFG